ncbi:MAG: hypothetical protein GVY06_09375 [Alphaproteobacteria bacterium]|nr:hypothetical protein [Alphaproteobacteria bacterium]
MAAPASAHSSVPGAEGLFLALAHPLTEPLQGLVAGTAGLLAARLGQLPAVTGLKLLLASGLAGLVAAFTTGIRPGAGLDIVLLLAAMGAAGWIAAFRRPPVRPGLGLAAIAGLAAGMNTIPEPGEGFAATLIGSYAGFLLAIVYLSGAGVWLARHEARHDWLHLVPRVIGAWIVAITMLVLAFLVSAR